MLVPRAFFLLALPLLAGCAAVTAADGRRMALGSAEFRSYVERVFREQNQAASELAFALEEPSAEDPSPLDGAKAPELGEAEQALLAACAGLNELATARRDERRVGLRRSVTLARKAPDCERATLAARSLLTRRASE
jgi:hypothetical protein